MSGDGVPAPVDPDRDMLAAEYVLGTLSAHEAAAAARMMEIDTAFAEAVAAWERRLAPLSDLATPEAPPPELWDRIEDTFARKLTAVTAARARARASWRMSLLGGWAFGASVVAAGLAVFIVLRGRPGPEPAPMMTVLLTDRTQSAWTAAVERDGALRLAAVPPPGGGTEAPLPADRERQLWVLPPGATAPTSLGVLPRGQNSVTVPASQVKPVPGMLIEISLEPPGGSPTGRPTGPILFIGRLSEAGPDS